MQIVQDLDTSLPVSGVKQIPMARQTAMTTREEATRLLVELQATLPPPVASRHGKGGGRRDSRRWIPPETVTIEVYDGELWHALEALDCGIPGVRVMDLPGFVGDGPAVVRLTTPDSGVVLVTGDVMWHDREAGTAGLHFTFQNDEDREAWFGGLVEALLSRHAMD
ncbi:MAG: PilZ domain-containing protein [Akkermansiaceae bacterium]|nr:PilZ domain-containing protein [Armatimonadota bacterium]